MRSLGSIQRFPVRHLKTCSFLIEAHHCVEEIDLTHQLHNYFVIVWNLTVKAKKDTLPNRILFKLNLKKTFVQLWFKTNVWKLQAFFIFHRICGQAALLFSIKRFQRQNAETFLLWSSLWTEVIIKKACRFAYSYHLHQGFKAPDFLDSSSSKSNLEKFNAVEKELNTKIYKHRKFPDDLAISRD